MLNLRIRKKTYPKSSGLMTVCCTAPMGVMRVGDELLLRCTKCGEHIGNVVSREIALIDSRYKQHMEQALADMKIELVPLEEHLDELYPVYCEQVLKFAEQAARTTLSAFFRGETP